MANVVFGEGQARLVAPMVDAILRLGEWRRRRQIRASCGPLSDSLLRDVGLTREDVEAALALSLDQNASDRMLREAVARAGNW
jgi:uncharacterized protein YjiS (DUF1127 family)